ncbi:MAG: hypothetical protein WBV22_01775 [Anaerolineaceae bacterium]
MKKTEMFVVLGLVIGALLLVACAPAVSTVSQSSTASDSAPAAPAAAVASGNCSVLSKDEVGAILGETVTQVRDEAKSTICAYQTQNMILEVNFLNTGGMSAVQYMDSMRSINANNVPVPGLGTDAFYNGNANYDLLIVRTGDKVNTFGLRSDPSSQVTLSYEDVQAKELAVAQLLVSRLK